MKYLLSITLALLIASSIHSQNKKGWEIGLEAGFNVSTMTGKYSESDNSNHKWIGSPGFGFTTAYNFTPLFAVVGGLFLIKSGVLVQHQNEYSGETHEWSQRERYTNLRIPIMARFTWGNLWQYYALAGFYVSKRLCGKYVYTDSNDTESGKIKFKKNPDDSSDGDDWIRDTEEFRRLNVGFIIGGGVRRVIGPGYLGVNATFGYGFCDFYKWKDKDNKPEGYKAYRDMNVAIMVTYVVLISTLMGK